ncbi:MAG TPA: hypothetical protein VNB06_05480 [Thermoanaerobaculia bacterium]|nr:hypothetical protein [Thermoanaerobaculia bacterium]
MPTKKQNQPKNEDPPNRPGGGRGDDDSDPKSESMRGGDPNDGIKGAGRQGPPQDQREEKRQKSGRVQAARASKAPRSQ